MKRTIYILLLAVFGILSATAENNFIEKFANQKGVTYVNISKALLNMMPEGQIDAEGLNLKAVINELDRIQILTCEDSDSSNAKRKYRISKSSIRRTDESKRRRRDRSFLRATQNRQKDQRINHAGR